MTRGFDPALLDGLASDADLAWAAQMLDLPANAFHGADGLDPRLAVMQSAGSIDVSACPGSGKTTLLVAKLAILARYWRHGGQGICVLSHTNVARLEIERRLGADGHCRSLLAYPHFIGTIHSFINCFIAFPWLRSEGYRPQVIDNALCCARRWSKLTPGQRTALGHANKSADDLRIQDTEFGLGRVSWGRGKLDDASPLYLAMVTACFKAAEEGYFCHEDMFLWAHEALDRRPELADTIRQRFPVLFLDEVQDNDAPQAALLDRIFACHSSSVVRCRFGDMNQAIYTRAEDSGAVVDVFPDPAIRIEVPNSHRFNQPIATAANPLGLIPAGLVGLRASRVEPSPLALLLFEPECAQQLLPAFGQLLVDSFTPEQLRDGDFAAVGSVQRDSGREDRPHCIVDYWADYDHRASGADIKPTRFLEFVNKGRAERGDRPDIHPIVERVAEALLRLATILNPAVRHPAWRSRHRQLIALLEDEPQARSKYQNLAIALATGHGPRNATSWQAWHHHILLLATALLGGASAGDPGDFLDWVEEAAPDPTRPRRDNVFSYPSPMAPKVHIKVGTIHSVKGETHTATLVLDTYYNGSHLKRVKDWLTVVKSGLPDHPPQVNLRKSLTQHYVAMTRPSDLLCVAMRAADISDDDLQRFRAGAWQIGDIIDSTVRWRS